MNSSQGQSLVVPPSTLKRVYKDLDEINKNPLFGASLCMPNQNNPLTLRANLFILDGPYKDLLIHLVIHIPPDYPMTGPAANIAPGLKFGHKYHEHLYDDLENGNQICSDLLTNMRGMYDSSRNLKSGWTPAYTLSSVLLQLQVFFADPDLPKHLLPAEEDIEALGKHVRCFKTTIELSDGQTVTHSFESPYPVIPSLEGKNKGSKEQISKKIDSDEKEIRRNAEEWLYCAISKCNFFDESQPILGYPLDIRQDQFGRYWPTPVMEMISYEAYILKVMNDPSKLENYEQVRFKSSFGELYNFWIPVYITEEHWKRAHQHILNAISVVKKGFRGLEENDFKPQMVLEVFPVILNKMIVQILQGKLHQSIAAIHAYCHFYRLFIRLLVEFPELQQKIDASVETMLKSEENRNKANLGDMGEFLIKLALSKYGIQNAPINEVLLEEYLARQVFWVLKDDPLFLKHDMKTQVCIRQFMKPVKVSYQLLVVAVETVKLVTNDSSLSQSDNNFGLISKKVMDSYQKKLAWIKETVAVNGNWESFVSSFKVEGLIRCDEDMARMIQKAFEISARQGYTYNSGTAAFQNSKKNTYSSEIPYNPNFDFARATKIKRNVHYTNSLLEPKKPEKTYAMMSNAKWEDLKVELKGFEADPIITVTLPSKNKIEENKRNSEQKSTASFAKEKSQRFVEETKERSQPANMKKIGTKVLVESKKTDTSNSTADNSTIHESEDSNKRSEQKIKYRSYQRKELKFFDEKARKPQRKEEKKPVITKEPEDSKPKTIITKVSGTGPLTSVTWSETGGIIKKIPPKVLMAK